MQYALATVMLAPLLLMQGLHVRRVTPRLPEAAGSRADRQGEGPLLRLLVLGDSAAAGVGAGSQKAALTGQLVSHLAVDRTVQWRLHAQTGWLLADLLSSLDAIEPAQFDVAVVSIGVNDVTGRTAGHRWRAGLRQLAMRLHRDLGVQHILFSPVPPMHHFPALPQPLRWYLGVRAKELNAQLVQVLRSDPQCELLTLTLPFERRFLASDGFHPSQDTYAEWGRQAAAAIRGRLRHS